MVEVGFLLFFRPLVFPPADGLDVQLLQRGPDVGARWAGGVAGEGGQGAPAEGEDAGDGEVGDGETGEEGQVGGLEGEAEGEEAGEGIMVWGGEGEVLQAW